MWPAKLYMKRGLHVHVQSAAKLLHKQDNYLFMFWINVSKQKQKD
jgi:hypothetical protein